jgi:uncharacterized protein YqgC (DUF456 family)
MDIVAAIIVTVFALLGVALVLFQGPGIWLSLLAALACQWWRGDLFNWWTLGAVALIAALAEIAEFSASAIGAAKAEGTRAGMWGAILGSLVGLVAGGFLIPIPILGSVIGAIVGAGLGALAAERGVSKRTWKESAAVGKGAAIGRLMSTVVKTAFACVAAGVLVAGAWIP